MLKGENNALHCRETLFPEVEAMNRYLALCGCLIVGLLWIPLLRADTPGLDLPPDLKAKAGDKKPDAKSDAPKKGDAVKKSDADKPSDADKKDSDKKKIDPIEAAFALPHGASVNELNDKQTKAYKELRKKFEPLLRDALKKMHEATEEKDKDKYARDGQRLVKEIKGEIDDIMAIPAIDAQKAAQKQAAEAQKRAAEAIKRERQRQHQQHYRHRYH
jgi:hypothetical protein